jgi:outer membrane protein assembly factor BamB
MEVQNRREDSLFAAIVAASSTSASADRSLYAVNAADGSQRWKFATQRRDQLLALPSQRIGLRQ